MQNPLKCKINNFIAQFKNKKKCSHIRLFIHIANYKTCYNISSKNASLFVSLSSFTLSPLYRQVTMLPLSTLPLTTNARGKPKKKNHKSQGSLPSGAREEWW